MKHEFYFRKYEFPSEEIYNELKSAIYPVLFNEFVDLVFLRDDKFSVDVLWCNDIPEEWKPYEIWDVDGNGSHTFAGFDFNRDDQNLNI